ncbi:hypothetical protein Acsp07_17180 [Actinomycetospora sp. NBRC 106378]|nr:hypothetical protein Acsp07_17180 [Actinomycetospora sp. NBRC 106378]
MIVLAQKRSRNNPTSKLIHGPVPWVTRSVTAVRVWMTLSLGAPAAGSGWAGRGNAAIVSDAAGADVRRPRPGGWPGRGRRGGDQPEIGESVTILSPSTR